MVRFGWIVRSITTVALVLVVAGVLFLSGGAAQQNQAESQKYMEPRYPSYLKPARSIADLMPGARAVVRNKAAVQSAGMGLVQEGGTIVLVTSATAEDRAVEAIRQALTERKIKSVVLHDYELGGVSRKDALDLIKATRSAETGENGREAAGFAANFPDPEKVKAWLKGRNPNLYAKLFPPGTELSDHLKEVREKLRGQNVGKAISAYVDKHPEVNGVFWGKGGFSYLRRYVYPNAAKLMGLFLWDNQYDIMNEMSSFPSDVWQMLETQTMDPLAYVDKIHLTDPEGTDLEADLTEEQAKRWEQGAFFRGHMYMGPNQAYARYGFSAVDYPAYHKEWLSPNPVVLANGVVATTNSDGGFYPRMEVHYKNGYVAEVKGGGVYGDGFREFLHYPGINELTRPFLKHPGYFYAYEWAFGTNPKAFRRPDVFAEGGSIGPERMRSGIVHLAVGVFVKDGPDGMGASSPPEEWIQFAREHNLPIDHSFHVRVQFLTYQVRLRNANRWVSLIEKGHLSSLDNPEVRALASRYGDPDRILSEDWVPGVPGINAPGRYEDYAQNPYKYAKAEMDQVLAGTYAHFYPPAKAQAPRGR